MAVNSVLAPYPTFFDATGAPLENGSIYIGQPGFEARSTPKASFFDVALTIPTGTASGAAIRTSGGFPVNQSGSPAMFYADGDFSISVTDRNGVLLYSALNNTLALNVGAAVGPVLWADGNLSAVGGGFASEANTGFVRPSANTMQTVVGGVLVSTQTVGGTVFAQPVSGAGFDSGVLAIAQPLDADLTQIAGLTRTRGDLIVGGASAWTDLALGGVGQSLVSNGTDAAWGTEGLLFRLNSAFAGVDATGAQNLFPQNVTLLAGTQYQYELIYSLEKTAGVVSHTLSVFWGGTATFNNFRRNLITTSVIAGGYAGALASFGADSAPATPVNASGTINFADARVHMRETGTFSVNAGGTVIPQYQLSAAPGGAYSTTIGAFFRLRRIGASGANIAIGPWA